MTDKNAADSDASLIIVAKTCGFTEKKKISYSFSQSYNDLCLDKKDIVLAQVEACERLLKYAGDQNDRTALGQEIKELKMALDFMT